MLLEVFPSGPAETNAYLLACRTTKKAAVIDVPFDSVEPILKSARHHQLSIEMILLTHSHWDHIGEVAKLKEKIDVPVYIHADDAENLETPGSDRLPLFLPVKGIRADAFLKDGQILTLGELQIQVVHTPGHTPGCVCFYLEKEHVLFSGDTLFQGTIGNLSFPTSRPDLMWGSLKRLAALPPDTKVYPGHGDPTTIGKEQWIAHAEERFN